MLQEADNLEIFHIPYYKGITRYIQLLGQDPRHKTGTKNIIVIVVVICIASISLPSAIDICTSLHDNDVEEVIECLPNFIASTISAVKILNIHFNRHTFNKLFQLITKRWKQLELNGELHILEEVVMQGNKMAQLYNCTLVIFMTLFLLFSSVPSILDIIDPLNETRAQQLFKVNYVFFNQDNYFFYVYIELFLASIITVITVTAADWLYMLIIHHNSGLFAVCGYKVQKATTIPNYSTDETVVENYMYQEFRNCAIIHKEAIGFYNLLNDCSQGSYFVQVGLNMLGISATVVQTVVNLDKPREAIRSAVFCGASQFHLFLLSLPSQVLQDNCSAFANNIYDSTWYRCSQKIQKLLYIMQIRCKKLCTFSAGGLYDMNIENFGIVSLA